MSVSQEFEYDRELEVPAPNMDSCCQRAHPTPDREGYPHPDRPQGRNSHKPWCTRPSGHTGDHMMHNWFGNYSVQRENYIIARWPNETDRRPRWELVESE